MAAGRFAFQVAGHTISNFISLTKERYINTRLVLIVLALFTFTNQAALAETVPIAGQSKDKVQGKCSGDGDVY